MTQEPGPSEPYEEVSTTDKTGRMLRVAIGLIAVLGIIAALVIFGSVRNAPVAVPNVVGESTRTAEATLASAKLTIGATQVVADPKKTTLTVTKQSPAAGSKAARGSAVDLTVNIQPYNLSTPSFVGMSRAQAGAQMATYPFTPVYLEQFSNTVPPEQVVSQSPKAGAPWATGKPVVVEVSLGKSTEGVHVPDLTGLSAANAQLTIESSGLSTQLFTVAETGLSVGSVISQLPDPGVLVRPGSAVAVFVAGATQP